MNSPEYHEHTNQRFFRKARYGTDRFVLVRQSRIHYIEAGRGDPVLLVSGSRSSYRLWNNLMPLMDSRFRLLAMDYIELEGLPGGPLLVESVRSQAELLADIIRLLNTGKVNLVGVGLGSAIAFNLAARFPELIERTAVLSGYINVPCTVDTELMAGKRKESPPAGGILIEEAKKIKCPLMYLYGSRTHTHDLNLKDNIEFLNKNHPQAWVVSLDGGIFEIALQKPAEITSLLLDFFKFKPGLRIG